MKEFLWFLSTLASAQILKLETEILLKFKLILWKKQGQKKIFSDIFSGSKNNRPELDKPLKIIQSGDTCTLEGKAIARQKPDFRDGRPKKFSRAQINHALEILKTHSYKQVSAMTGISPTTLVRAKASRKLIDSWFSFRK